MSTSSPYIRLKLLLSPPSPSGAAPATTSLVVKKVEVPRALSFDALQRRLATLAGVAAAPPAAAATTATQTDDHTRHATVSCEVALDAGAAGMADDRVCRSDLVQHLTWRLIETHSDWTAATLAKDKLLVRLTPTRSTPTSAASTTAASSSAVRAAAASVVSARPFLLQPVIARKSPAPWPKYNPDPSTLPIIIMREDEHEWEVLDDDDEDEDEDEFEHIDFRAATISKKVDAKAGRVPGQVVARPHRVVPAELLAKLTGGSTISSSSALPPATTSVTFAVNKETYVVENPSPTLKLADWMRYQAGITGQKIGCGEGGCGACTVLLSKQNATSGQTVQFSTNSCVHPLAALDGWAVTTTEGLGTEHTKLHPIQSAMVTACATQCGYCSPGFVMSMYGLMVNNSSPTQQEIEDRFDGNLCRCTGYRPIFKAMRSVVSSAAIEEHAAANASTCGSKCGGCSSGAALTPCGKGDGASCSSGAKSACHSRGVTCGTSSTSSCTDMEDLLSPSTYDATNPEHNINPFPRELVEYNHKRTLAAVSPRVTWSADSTAVWIEPTTLDDVFAILTYYATAGEVVRLVVGNTSIGVSKYYPATAQDSPTVYVNLANLSVLTSVNLVANVGISIGAAVTINTVVSTLESVISSLPAASVSSWTPLVRHLKIVANTGVRNVASWAGNLMTAKHHPEFPSDLLTIFAGVGCTLTLVSASKGTRTCDVADFQTLTMYTDEVVQQLNLPFTPSNFVFDCYKVRARHQNAHPIINAAYQFTFEADKNAAGNLVIASARIVLGGLVDTGLFHATKTCAYLVGTELNDTTTLAGALAQLDAECVAGGRTDPTSTFFMSDPAYRHSLVLTTFYKFYLEQLAAAGVTLPTNDTSAYEQYVRAISSGSEVFTPDASTAPVGAAVPKLESSMQVSGTAIYIDDMPMAPNALWGSYVYSTVAVGTISSIDSTAALAMPGVVQLLTAADIASLTNASNNCGSFPGDEEIFATKDITTTGQAIGMILADTRQHADEAAAAVVVNYTTPTTTTTPILSIAEALAASPQSIFESNQYMQAPSPVTCGDFDTAYKAAPMKLTGTSTSSGQAHFYMETQTCYAIPAENDSLLVHSSSQGPTDIRGIVMRCTGLPANKVVVTTRRAGGGFGGKLSRSHPIACATALAARITNRPIKSQMSRTADMDMFGKRPDMNVTWEVGFDKTGKISALNTTFYQQGGHTYESNFGSMTMCLLWSDNAYYIPNFTATGVTCKTNTPSSTAMRCPGAFKSIWNIEYVMEAVAVALNMSPNDVRAANFYTEGQTTPYQQPVTDITLPTVWKQLQTQADYTKVATDVATFNKANKWRKRGVHMTPVKYGIAVPGNQIGLLMNIMQDDGTIIVSHTGTELGQGINTKVAQTIAYELDIDISLIIVGDNATNIVANGSQTGGSATSEAACAAAILACADLNARLAPVKKANPKVTAWADLIPLAAAALVNLTVSAQYNVAPGDAPFSYFVWAAACSQVELDVLTGEMQVLQTDIVYDAGNSLNPDVDIGQIEGAFMQAIGHYLMEQVDYQEKTGRLTTRGTWDYHPPSSQDIPIALNVTLLASSPNKATNAVLGSKATAEPPMVLGSSVFWALRDCIAAVRADRGLSGWFDLSAPASTQAVQLACGITTEMLVV